MAPAVSLTFFRCIITETRKAPFLQALIRVSQRGQAVRPKVHVVL